jgi:hypothetical protein
MARPRTANVMLPRDVQRVVKPSGRVYYYYAPRRGTAKAGKRVPLGGDTADPGSGAYSAKRCRLLLLVMARCQS